MPSSLNQGIFGANSKRFVGSACSQQAQKPLNATKRKEIGTFDFQPTINLPKKQAIQKPIQNQSLLSQVILIGIYYLF